MVFAGGMERLRRGPGVMHLRRTKATGSDEISRNEAMKKPRHEAPTVCRQENEPGVTRSLETLRRGTATLTCFSFDTDWCCCAFVECNESARFLRMAGCVLKTSLNPENYMRHPTSFSTCQCPWPRDGGGPDRSFIKLNLIR